jgi:hypothetical protein
MALKVFKGQQVQLEPIQLLRVQRVQQALFDQQVLRVCKVPLAQLALKEFKAIKAFKEILAQPAQPVFKAHLAQLVLKVQITKPLATPLLWLAQGLKV